MALKTRLFLAFIFMIMLSVISTGISIRAFREAGRAVEDARGMIDYVTTDLIPSNDRWMNISSGVVGAGLHYYSYAYNFNEGDYKRAGTELDRVNRELAELEKILAASAPDRLAASRSAFAECRKRTGEMAGIGGNINAADRKLKELNTKFATLQEEITAIADENYNTSYASVKELFGDSGADEAEIARRTGRLEFLSHIFDCVAWSSRTFWHAQSLRGEAAAAFYDETGEMLDDLASSSREYNTPENVADAELRGQFAHMGELGSNMLAATTEIRDLYLAIDSLTQRMGDLSDSTTALVREAAGQTSGQVLESARSIRDGTGRIDDVVAFSERMQAAVLGVILLIGLGLAYLITRGIVSPIDQAIRQLNEGERIISGAADDITLASRDLAEGATEQAAALEETSSALEHISSMSKLSAENAHRTNDQTRNTVELVREGSLSMRDMATAMGEIDERSERVSQIIKTIEDIAFQTNLLALNAAVEAARAGEAGKGFAVVADEVRNLSQRSAAAARDTTALIQGTVESIRKGSGIARKLSESYQGIESGAGGIGDLIDQIAKASVEQADGVEQVNNAVARMDKVTQRNASSSEQTAVASNGLGEQVAGLRSAIRRLSSVVYGRDGRSPAESAKGPRDGGRKKPGANAPARPAPRLAGPASAPRIMRPDAVIPLEGDEL